MIPYYGFGSEFILNKQKIYYNRFGAEEGIELYSKKTKGFSFGKEELDQAGICTISPEYMYYLKESEADDFENDIYRKNLKTGKTEVYLKGEFSYILRQDHGKLYTYNNAFKHHKLGYASANAWVMFIIIMILTALVFKSSSTWVFYETEARNSGAKKTKKKKGGRK